ncbi:MAG: hypothetical protein R3E98_18145 [Gemmatimonadota bacterium]
MSARAPDRKRAEIDPVTAIFESAESVEHAVRRLVTAGLPRDLVEVAVSPAGAERFYAGAGRTHPRDAFRGAAAGGLVGLVVGAALAVVLIAWPGFQEPGLIAWLQLLGPNVTTVGGALVGGGVGWLTRRRPPAWHARLEAAGDRIIVAVRVRGDRERSATRHILEEAGGVEVVG